MKTDSQIFHIQIYEVSRYKICLFFDLSNLLGPLIINSGLFSLLIAGVIAATLLLHVLGYRFYSSNHVMLHLGQC
jgi:hypothetical protein